MVALTSSIVTAVVDATAATARLDQALSSSASLAAWTEQMVIEEACAGQAIEGNLITKLDLTLALENTPNALGQGDMLSARRHVRNLTTLLRQTNKPDWGLKPLYRIMSRVKVIGGVPNAAPSDAFILYDYDLKTDDIISQWLTRFEERRAYPGLLAIAASLFDWLHVEPFSYTDKHRVMLLGETLSRRQGQFTHAPLNLCAGARLTHWQPRAHNQNDFLVSCLRAIEAGAQKGIRTLASLEEWKTAALLFCEKDRSSSHASAFVSLACNNYVFPANHVAKLLNISPQAALKICTRFQQAGFLNEITGQKTYKLWQKRIVF